MKLSAFLFPLALALSALAACRDDDSQPLPDNLLNLGDTATIAFHESVAYLPDGFEVYFDTLLEDSRCPLNVLCPWPGRADVRLRFRLGTLTHTDTLGVMGAVQVPPADSVTVWGYTVQLLNVFPYPQDPGQAPVQDYTVQVVVSQ